jgi:hypothetical protein
MHVDRSKKVVLTSLTDVRILSLQVAYCKGRYNVTLWEVGNQPHNQLSSGDYSLWLARFSVAMKAVNPAVKIGVSGDDPAWLDAVLKKAGSHVDWISVSVSPLESEPINRFHQRVAF